jgi:hypothetical protein
MPTSRALTQAWALGASRRWVSTSSPVITLIPYRKYERSAWYTLWLLPLLCLSLFVFSPDLVCLMLALVTTAGLVLTYQRFFSRAASREEGPADIG